MKELISSIKNALQSEDQLVNYLNKNTALTWEENYPIAIVHEQNRVKDTELLAKMEDLYFFGDDGFSQEKYTPKMIEFLTTHAPKHIKQAALLCYDGPLEHAYTFKEKFTHDRWKKVLNSHNFQATVEISNFDSSVNNIQIETELRDYMRSRKEIPSLKKIAFIWIATVKNSTNIQNIVKHYFSDKYEVLVQGETTTYICWNEKLKDINLRHFVYTPQ